MTVKMGGIKMEESVYIKTMPHPWLRYFARMIDYMFYSLLWRFILLHICRIHTGNLISLLLGIVSMLLLEGVFLSTIGTTLGKGIIGYTVRTMEGEKLTYKQAFIRTFQMWATGEGYRIPIYEWYRLYKSYIACSENQILPWDEEYQYIKKEMNNKRVAVLVLSYFLLFGIQFTIIKQAELPIHRGAITAQEFYENCNDYLEYHKSSLEYRLNQQGEWERIKEADYNMIVLFEKVLPIIKVEEEDGYVKEVMVSIEEEGRQEILSPIDEIYMVYTAFVGTSKQFNGYTFLRNEDEKKLQQVYENYIYIKGENEITNTVVHRGYSKVKQKMLISKGEEDRYYHWIFHIRKR